MYTIYTISLYILLCIFRTILNKATQHERLKFRKNKHNYK